MASISEYKARQFDLSGLTGISDETLEIHFKLYEGYVAETNKLNARIEEMTSKGPVSAEDLLTFSALKRRLGFEYNGMVLHEYYFDNMKKQGSADPENRSPFREAAGSSYGSYEAWKNDFAAVGKMRGIGWAICFADTTNGRLTNQFVELHETNNVAGYEPIVVMDVWEHAWFRDYKPAEKAKYIEAFFSNMNWEMIEKRLAAIGGRGA